jgi:Ribose/Galactose Isomerase
MMRVGIAADHGGFALKMEIALALRTAGHEVVDFGARILTSEDDYPDYVAPLARAVAKEEAERAVKLFARGSGWKDSPKITCSLPRGDLDSMIPHRSQMNLLFGCHNAYHS